jgi:acyl-CoA-binding protein
MKLIVNGNTNDDVKINTLHLVATGDPIPTVSFTLEFTFTITFRFHLPCQVPTANHSPSLTSSFSSSPSLLTSPYGHKTLTKRTQQQQQQRQQTTAMSAADDDIQTQFEKAAEKARETQGVSTENKKKLYAYYKQSTEGPIKSTSVTRPGIFDQVGRAKYDAWEALGDMSKDEAMKLYIELVHSL